MTKRIYKSTLLIALFLAFALPACADIFYFNTSNEFGDWTGDPSSGYASIEIKKDLDTGYVKFEIKANEDYFTAVDPGLTWDKFYFNVGLGIELDDSDIEVYSDGTWGLVFDKTEPIEGVNVSSFGLFDYGETGTAIKNSAINPLEFAITDTSLDVLDFIYPNDDGYFFSGHLRRFSDIDGQTSTFLAVGAPVPEPGTLLLIGSGLSGLLLYRRRRA